jgi:hypothetical protein
MSDTDADEREQGIDFEGLGDELESHDYPTTAGALVDEYGDHELSLPSGSTTVGEVLGRTNDEQEFDSAEEVETAIYNFVGDDAVGAENYSDRGTGADENESDAV